jgi:hypothetical protein
MRLDPKRAQTATDPSSLHWTLRLACPCRRRCEEGSLPAEQRRALRTLAPARRPISSPWAPSRTSNRHSPSPQRHPPPSSADPWSEDAVSSSCEELMMLRQPLHLSRSLRLHSSHPPDLYLLPLHPQASSQLPYPQQLPHHHPRVPVCHLLPFRHHLQRQCRPLQLHCHPLQRQCHQLQRQCHPPQRRCRRR